MPKCKQCNGSGYDKYGGDTCHSCNGTGYIEYWETKKYRETGKMPEKDKVDAEKGYVTLGLMGGGIIGVWAYMLTLDIGTAIAVGMITALLAATLLRLFFKYLLAIFVIGYVLYLLFG